MPVDLHPHFCQHGFDKGFKGKPLKFPGVLLECMKGAHAPVPGILNDGELEHVFDVIDSHEPDKVSGRIIFKNSPVGKQIAAHGMGAGLAVGQE